MNDYLRVSIYNSDERRALDRRLLKMNEKLIARKRTVKKSRPIATDVKSIQLNSIALLAQIRYHTDKKAACLCYT